MKQEPHQETITLQSLGLTENESKVYLFLLEQGPSTILEITKTLPIHRVNLYDIIKRLQEKGLASSTREGRKTYCTATDPSYLQKLLQEKQQFLEKILPELEKKKQKAKAKHEVQVFQGKQGIKAILEDMLKTKSTIYVFGAQGKFQETLPLYFEQFNHKRKKEKIKLKILYSERIRQLRESHPIQFSEIHYLTHEYTSPSTTFIYQNKVAIIMWTDPPLGILIESKELNQTYQSFWNILESISKE